MKKKTGLQTKYFSLLLVVGVALALIFGSNSEQPSTPQRSGKVDRRQTVDAPSTTETLPDQLHAAVVFGQELDRALAAVVQGSERGRALLAMYRTNAVPIVVVTRGDTKAMISAVATTFREDTFMVGRVTLADQTPHEYGSYASFDAPDRLLKVLNVPMSVCWMGFIAAHELVHVYDFLSGNEQPSHAGSDAYAGGEVRAHDLEIELIDQWTRGAFRSTVAMHAAALDFAAPVEQRQAAYAALDALFPPSQSVVERGARHGLYLIAAGFFLAEQVPPERVFEEKKARYQRITSQP